MRPLDPVKPVVGYDIGISGGFVFNINGSAKAFKNSEGNFLEELRSLKKFFPSVVVYAENVHPFKDQGITSSGNLMEQKGVLRGRCEALDVPLIFIEPEEWICRFTLKRRKHFLSASGKKNTTKWKRHLEEIAKELSREVLVNEICLEVADAFLIWNYAAHVEVGMNLPALEEPKLQFK